MRRQSHGPRPDRSIASAALNHLASKAARTHLPTSGGSTDPLQPQPDPHLASARALLREHTHDAHQRLHRLTVFRALLAGTLEREGYGRLLTRLHDYYRGVDASLLSACRRLALRGEDYAYQPRAAMFAADLVTLGFACTPAGADLPPTIETPAALAGALYVIEGSLLGGATLDDAARRLLPASHAADTQGRSYWAWCRQVASERWQSTTSFIERLAHTPNMAHAAIAAAHATFTSMHLCLESLHEPSC